MKIMSRKILIPFVIVAIITFGLMSGGFVTFGQMNIGKIGDEIIEDVQGAAGESQENLAQGMAANAPVSTGGADEVTPVEDMDQDALRDAIMAVNEYKAFAGSARKVVRNYISKIKIRQQKDDLVFAPGTEPWLSEKAELRYSPFDPQVFRPKTPEVIVELQPPFLPPTGGGGGGKGPKLEDLRPLINLKMTTKQDGKFVALAEIAGIPVRLAIGDTIPLPAELGLEVIVEDISLNSVFLRSGGDSLHIPFAGVKSTEKRPLEIVINK